jgi:hypothetical protein
MITGFRKAPRSLRKPASFVPRSEAQCLVAATAATTTATAAAVAAAVATAAATATTAAATALTRLGLVDLQAATLEVGAVQRRHGAGGIGIGHFHEAEAAGTTGLTIGDQRDLLDRTMLLEQGADRLFSGREGQISNK